VHPAGEIIGRAAQLARAFRQHGLPVLLVNLTGVAPGRTDAGCPTFSRPTHWTELVPELERHSDDYLGAARSLRKTETRPFSVRFGVIST
jgi:nicotinamidase-related amidase